MLPTLLLKIMAVLVLLVSSSLFRSVLAKPIPEHQQISHDDEVNSNNLLVIQVQFIDMLICLVAKKNDDSDIGEPLTEEEFNSDISVLPEDGKEVRFLKFHHQIIIKNLINKEEDESGHFIPWGRPRPKPLDCDTNGRKNILNSRELWPNAKIPYIISVSYSRSCQFG